MINCSKFSEMKGNMVRTKTRKSGKQNDEEDSLKTEMSDEKIEKLMLAAAEDEKARKRRINFGKQKSASHQYMDMDGNRMT